MRQSPTLKILSIILMTFIVADLVNVFFAFVALSFLPVLGILFIPVLTTAISIVSLAIGPVLIFLALKYIKSEKPFLIASIYFSLFYFYAFILQKPVEDIESDGSDPYTAINQLNVNSDVIISLVVSTLLVFTLFYIFNNKNNQWVK